MTQVRRTLAETVAAYTELGKTVNTGTQHIEASSSVTTRKAAKGTNPRDDVQIRV